MGGDFDTEQAQALERTADCFGVLRFDDVEIDLQAISGRFVDL